jgi:hypothetical protein
MSDREGESPFRAIHANAWADPVDVPSINRDASDLILQRIDEVRRAGLREGAELASTSVLLLGPAGSGKTHLFARLRKQVRGPAAFIHTRPQIGVDPTPRFVLASIVDSLKRPVLGDQAMQLAVVAGAILAANDGGNASYPLMQVEEARQLSPDDRRALVERVVARVEDRFPEISAEVLERLLEVPFAGRQEQRALLAWLSGREPSALDLERIGASGPLADLDVMKALATLGVAAAFGAPVVLVFDQLENLAEDRGTARIHAHARLVSDLRDTVRGLVIVQMALDAEWVTRIHPALHESDRARLEETVKTLGLPTPDERRALLESWRAALPAADRARPAPHPFTPAEVEAWIHHRGMTPRMLMQACGEAFLRASTGAPPAEPIPAEAPAATPDEALRIQWEQAIDVARDAIDEAAQQARGVEGERIVGGLMAALRLLGAEVTTASTKSGPSLRTVKDGVTTEVLTGQHGHPRSLAAAIRVAKGLAAGRRVLFVRERAQAIPPTWKEVDRLLAELAATPGAAFAPLEREDVARLLALEAFVTAARSQDLSADDGRPILPADALRWAAEAIGCAAWGPVAAILAPATVPDPVPGAVRERERERERDPEIVQVTMHAGNSPVRAALERLRVASIERLVRETKALDPSATRATVLDELRRLPVRIFGASIVALEDR